MSEHGQAWQFEQGELPTWSGYAPPTTSAEFDFGIGVPAVTPEPLWPPLARGLLLRLAIAILFPWAMQWGLASNQTPLSEILTKAFLFGCALGVGLYLYVIANRRELDGPDEKPPGLIKPIIYFILNLPPNYLLIGPPLGLPGLLLLTRVLSDAYDSRFNGVVIASVVCVAVFYRFGKRPIDFMQELLLADPSTANSERRTRPRFDGSPDVKKLSIVLLIVLLVPAYLSTASGICFVLAFCVFDSRRAIQLLSKYGSPRVVLSALGIRLYRIAFEYLDYAQIDANHWRPPVSLTDRRLILTALYASLDFALLTGITYYCPWEPFAALFVPGSEVNSLWIPHYDMSNFHWLHLPLDLAKEASPLGGYLVCYVIAVVLWVILPPMILLLIYIEPLTKLENMAQELKRNSF